MRMLYRSLSSQERVGVRSAGANHLVKTIIFAPMKSQIPQYYQSIKRTELNAITLRKPLTPAEERFWKMARNRNLLGLKFRRQHPIGPFIADFYCHELKLVVEIDGDVHDLEDVKQYDEQRENYIKELGLKVLRFQNGDVFKNARIIEEALRLLMAKQ